VDKVGTAGHESLNVGTWENNSGPGPAVPWSQGGEGTLEQGEERQKFCPSESPRLRAQEAAVKPRRDWGRRGGRRESGTFVRSERTARGATRRSPGSALPHQGAASLRCRRSTNLRASVPARLVGSRLSGTLFACAFHRSQQWMATPCSQYQGKTRFLLRPTRCRSNSLLLSRSLTNLSWGSVVFAGSHEGDGVAALGSTSRPSCGSSCQATVVAVSCPAGCNTGWGLRAGASPGAGQPGTRV
jgi:hypothetical protein